jgi:hypothetical protein
MPRYDMRCPSCGWEGEIACSVSVMDQQQCDELVSHDGSAICGARLQALVSPVQAIGALWSKPIVVEQLGGKRFESTREYNRFLREKGFSEADKSDSTVRKTLDAARERGDVTARAQGFRDQDHRTQVKRAEKQGVKFR